MASSVDSFMCSVLCWFVTLATNWGMSSGHWLMGISAQAMPATHCEAELGLYVSVPSVCRTCGKRSAQALGSAPRAMGAAAGSSPAAVTAAPLPR